MRPLDRLATPAPFPDDELRRAGEDLLASVDGANLIPNAAPGFDRVGRQLADVGARPVPTGAFYYGVFGQEPGSRASGSPAVVNSRFFRREPVGQLAADGTFTIRFETTRPCGGASAYYGTELQGDPLGRARLRRRAGDVEGVGDELRIAFDVRPLLRTRYDVTHAFDTGRLVVRWRLEALDAERGTSRVYDGRTAFRCLPASREDGPGGEIPPQEIHGCTPTSRLQQLPTVVLGPFVDQVGPDRAVISFETDVPTRAVVLVRSEGEATETVRSVEGQRHEVELTGLTPNTRYRYAVLVVDARLEVGRGRSATFETWPEPENDQRFTFAVFSDSRSGHGSPEEQYAGTNRRVLDDLFLLSLREGSRFAVFVGDLVDGYTTHPGSFRYELEAWQRASEPVGAHMPIYEVMGNHEALIDFWDVGWAKAKTGDESPEAEFARRFVNPENAPEPLEGDSPYAETVYSFDAGSAHLAVVNSNYHWRSHPDRGDHPAAGQGYREGWVTDAQVEWLDRDLAAARERGQRHLFVFTHEPGFPNGGHVEDGMWWEGEVPEVLAMRARLFRVMARHRVAAIFHGDEHNYSRTLIDDSQIEGLEHPLWSIISGGAGAPYYAQNRDVPWASQVRAFDARQHLVLVRIDGDRASARAVSRNGETIDRFDLTAFE